MAAGAAPQASADGGLAAPGITVDVQGLRAIDGVDLALRPGEILGVIGPNGAGKTTLLQTIAGVLMPRLGDLLLDGRSLSGASPKQRVRAGIALVPEGPRIFAALTVAQNLAIGATVRADRAAVAADLERFWTLFLILRKRWRHKAGKLSGGEQQMLAIARAMLARPRVLLVDEPSLGPAPLVLHQVFEAIRGGCASRDSRRSWSSRASSARWRSPNTPTFWARARCG